MTTYFILYIVSALYIAGLEFAHQHRDGVTDPAYEWANDLRAALWLGVFLGLTVFFGIFIAWVLSEHGKRGWTLIPDRRS